MINIGNDELMTIRELAAQIIKITNSSSKLIFLPPLKDGDMTRRQPDNTKMKQILNKKLISVEEGIRLMTSNKKFLSTINLVQDVRH